MSKHAIDDILAAIGNALIEANKLTEQQRSILSDDFFQIRANLCDLWIVIFGRTIGLAFAI